MEIYNEDFGRLLKAKQQIIKDQLNVNLLDVSLQKRPGSLDIERQKKIECVAPNVFYAFAGKCESNFKIFQKVTAYKKWKDNLASTKIEIAEDKNTFSKVTKNEFRKIVSKDETIEDFLKDLKENRLEWKNETRKERSHKIRRVITEGSYPNISVEEEKLCTILRLSWKGKTEKLEKYLADNTKHEKINRQDEFGRTALHFAASWGCTKTMEMLLKVPGIDLNIKDAHNMTALFKAAELNSLESVKMLVENGANVKIHCRDGRNVLDYIIQEYGDESLSVVRYLLNTGKFDDEPNKNDRSVTSLHKLCLARKNVSVEEIAEVLIDRGMDVNGVEGKGRTPLMLAVICKRDDVTRSLFRRFADINVYDDKFKTAVDYAVKETYAFNLLSSCRGSNVRVLFHKSKIADIKKAAVDNGKTTGKDFSY